MLNCEPFSLERNPSCPQQVRTLRMLHLLDGDAPLPRLPQSADWGSTNSARGFPNTDFDGNCCDKTPGVPEPVDMSTFDRKLHDTGSPSAMKLTNVISQTDSRKNVGEIEKQGTQPAGSRQHVHRGLHVSGGLQYPPLSTRPCVPPCHPVERAAGEPPRGRKMPILPVLAAPLAGDGLLDAASVGCQRSAPLRLLLGSDSRPPALLGESAAASRHQHSAHCRVLTDLPQQLPPSLRPLRNPPRAALRLRRRLRRRPPPLRAWRHRRDAAALKHEKIIQPWRGGRPRGPLRAGGTSLWRSSPRSWAHGGARWREGGALADPNGREEHRYGAPFPAAGSTVAQGGARGAHPRTPTGGWNIPMALLFPQLRARWRKVARGGRIRGPLRAGGTLLWRSFSRSWAHGRARWREGGTLADPNGREEHPYGAPLPTAGRTVAQGGARGAPSRTPTGGWNTPMALLYPQLGARSRKVARGGLPRGPLRAGGTPQWRSFTRSWAHGGARWREGGALADPYGRVEHPYGAPLPAAGRTVAQGGARGAPTRTPTGGWNIPMALLFLQLRARWRKVARGGRTRGPQRAGGAPLWRSFPRSWAHGGARWHEEGALAT
eukprot:gene8089-biopygen9731